MFRLILKFFNDFWTGLKILYNPMPLYEKHLSLDLSDKEDSYSIFGDVLIKENKKILEKYPNDSELEKLVLENLEIPNTQDAFIKIIEVNKQIGDLEEQTCEVCGGKYLMKCNH